jgi:PAS domain S-box-containing protein
VGDVSNIVSRGQARIRQAVAAAAPAVWDWDVSEQRLTVSKRLRTMYGLPTARYIDFDTLVGLTHPSDTRWAEGIRSGEKIGPFPIDFRYRFRRQDDHAVQWARVHINAEIDRGGAILAYTGVVEDATEQVRAMQAAMEGQERLRVAIEAGKMALWEVDLDAGSVTVTPELNLLFGFPVDATPSFADYRSRYAPGEVERLAQEGATLEVVRARFARGEFDQAKRSTSSDHTDVQAELTIIMPDGTPKQLLYRAQYAYTWDGRPKITGLLVDITERKRAEDVRAQYSAIVESSGDAIYVYDFDGIVLAWNRAAEELYGYSAAEMIGQNIGLIIPAEHKSEIQHSLVGEVKAGRTIRNFEAMRLRRDGSAFAALLTASPIRDKMGRPVALSVIARDITERKQAEEELIAATAKFESVFNQSAIFAGIVDLQGHLLEVNDLAVNGCGYTRSEVLGLKFWETPWWRGSEEIKDRIRFATDQARSGAAFHEELRYWVANGSERRVDFAMHPIRDSSGSVRFLHPTGVDITDRKKAEEQARVLMAEVNHRAKNMLGLVQAIARQTAFTSAEDFIARFDERIQALASNQDLLVKSGWKNIPLEALVRSQLKHLEELLDTRIAIRGPEVTVTAPAAQTFSMAVHELATNAVKHGALSGKAGRVEFSWDVHTDESGGPCFSSTWVERGGPPISVPGRRGFGSTVLSTLIKLSLNGTVTHDFAPQGVLWRLTCPLEKIVEGAPTLSSSPAALPRSQPAAKRTRILLVEDEALVGMEAMEELSAAGYEVIGPAGSVAHALFLLEAHSCDVAALDVNLGNETAEPVAVKLAAAGIPFVTMSGYAREQLPSGFRSSTLLLKPLRPGSLATEVGRCLERARSPVHFTHSSELLTRL